MSKQKLEVFPVFAHLSSGQVLTVIPKSDLPKELDVDYYARFYHCLDGTVVVESLFSTYDTGFKMDENGSVTDTSIDNP